MRSVEHTEQGYDDSPDYNGPRSAQLPPVRGQNPRRRARRPRLAGYNVKQEEGVKLFEALPEDDATGADEGVPFKGLYSSRARGHRTTTTSSRCWTGSSRSTLPEGRQRGRHRARGALRGPLGRTRRARAFAAERAGLRRGPGQVLFLGRGPGGGELDSRAGGIAGRPLHRHATRPRRGSELAPAAGTNWLFYGSRAIRRRCPDAGDARLEPRSR